MIFEYEIIKDLYLIQKLPAYKIANIFSCSDTTLGKFLKQSGLFLKKHPWRDLEHIQELLDDNMSPPQIGKRLGCHPCVIQRIVVDNQLIKRRWNDDAVRDIYDSGRSALETSLLFNVSKPTILESLHRTGTVRTKHLTSSQERILASFLENNDISFIINDRTQIKPLELDLYLPDYNIAIEINGIYWHSTKFKDKNYHYNKYLSCKNVNISLLQFWDVDVNTKFNTITETIINRCNNIISMPVDDFIISDNMLANDTLYLKYGYVVVGSEIPTSKQFSHLTVYDAGKTLYSKEMIS